METALWVARKVARPPGVTEGEAAQEAAARLVERGAQGFTGAALRMRAYWDTKEVYSAAWRKHYATPHESAWADLARFPDPRVESDAGAVMDVRAAVAGLRPSWREAVEAVCLAGESAKGYAARIGISQGACRARLHKARAALRGALAAYAEC